MDVELADSDLKSLDSNHDSQPAVEPLLPSKELHYASDEPLNLLNMERKAMFPGNTGAQILWWIILEAGLIALAGVCLTQGMVDVPKAWASDEKRLNSALTTLLIIWQTVALFPILDILANIFCSEWSYLHRRSSRLVPGETDRVSVMTSGPLDRIAHAFLSDRGSRAFRAGVVASIGATALQALAPSMIEVSSLPFGVPGPITVGSLQGALLSANAANSAEHGALTDTILDLEQLFSGTYGYTVNPPDCTVDWPSLDYMQNASSFSYSSSTFCWKHECYWVPEPILQPLGPTNITVVLALQWLSETYSFNVSLAQVFGLIDEGGGLLTALPDHRFDD
jgi:hypothetical protein